MTAYEYGRKAYLRGKPAMPSLDESFMSEKINGLMVGEGSVELMREWFNGWHTENLNGKY